jgi:hypothetical protein
MTPNQFVNHCQYLGQQDGPVDYKAIVHDTMEKAKKVSVTDYLETFYEIVAFFYSNQENEFLLNIENTQGRGGMWELANTLTDEFQKLHENTPWGEASDLDFYDTLYEFLNERLK